MRLFLVCADEGLCTMACDDGPCGPGSTCITETIFGESFSYCLANCATPNGEQAECPSAQLVCVDADGAYVCATADGGIIY